MAELRVFLEAWYFARGGELRACSVFEADDGARVHRSIIDAEHRDLVPGVNPADVLIAGHQEQQ